MTTTRCTAAAMGYSGEFFDCTAQQADCSGGFVCLLLRCGTLHGQKDAAGLHKGQGQLRQDRQPGDGPGDGDRIRLPAAGDIFLRPGRDALRLQPKGGEDLFPQPADAFCRTIQQGQVKIRLGNQQRDAGKSGPAADVNDLFAAKVRQL